MKSIIKFPVMACLAAGLSLTSCTNKEKDEAALKQVNELSSSRDSLEDALVTTMDEINQNLDKIRSKQNIIVNNSGSESVSKKQEIIANIQAINALIEDNQAKIAKLEEQARKLGKEKSAMAKLASQTKFRIARQEDEIALLKDQLAEESFKVEDLNKRVQTMQATNDTLTGQKNELTATNSKMDMDLNKAWFMYGTYKELKEKDLIEKKGGVLGIGKKEVLSNAFYRNKASFTEVDIRVTKTIPIQGKKPKLITFHPANSYQLQENSGTEYSNLTITNPEEFWSSSRYLVVQVK
jgi:outer membrane murein-binding lipoprotein Lpp